MLNNTNIPDLVSQLESRHINIAESREEWVHLAFAFATMGEEGRSLFHRVARQSTKYEWKANERQFNDALRSRGRSAHPITIASFVQRCKELNILPTPSVQTQYHPVHTSSVHDPAPCHFLNYLAYVLTPEQYRAAQQLYHLESRTDGAIIFWLIDQQGRYHGGKVMYYQPDGHRDKDERRHPRWVQHLSANGQEEPKSDQPCLFGQHLLTLYPHLPVAIVESEKTAILASQLERDLGFLWMATGGESFLRVENFEVMRSRKVIVFPDTDTTGQTFRHWADICQKASRRYNMYIHVSRLLERMASDLEKERKIDLADKIITL